MPRRAAEPCGTTNWRSVVGPNIASSYQKPFPSRWRCLDVISFHDDLASGDRVRRRFNPAGVAAALDLVPLARTRFVPAWNGRDAPVGPRLHKRRPRHLPIVRTQFCMWSTQHWWIYYPIFCFKIHGAINATAPGILLQPTLYIYKQPWNGYDGSYQNTSFTVHVATNISRYFVFLAHRASLRLGFPRIHLSRGVSLAVIRGLEKWRNFCLPLLPDDLDFGPFLILPLRASRHYLQPMKTLPSISLPRSCNSNLLPSCWASRRFICGIISAFWLTVPQAYFLHPARTDDKDLILHRFIS